MARPIKKGMPVRVLWNELSIDGKGYNRGTVLSTPQATGDMWYIEVVGENGKLRVLAVNPQSAGLDGILTDE